MISVIIPIDLKYRKIQLIERAFMLAQLFEDDSFFEILFLHNNRGSFYDKYFIKKLSNLSALVHSDCYYICDNVNLSKLRNVGASYASRDYFFFCDVDVVPSKFLMKLSAIQIGEGIKPFAIWPCFYLTRKASRLFLKKKISLNQLADSYTSYSKELILHLACPSSLILIRKTDYYQIGGFDENFFGHGYEDFDFLICLFKKYKLLHQPLHQPLSYSSPMLANGFLKELAAYCLETLFSGEFFIHLYHKRNNIEQHKANRIRNLKYLNRKHNMLYSNSNLTEDFVSMCSLYVELSRSNNIPIDRFLVLFTNRPGHIDRQDTFARKIKLLLNK